MFYKDSDRFGTGLDRFGQVWPWFSYRFGTGLGRFKSSMLQNSLVLTQVWEGRRQVPTGFFSIFTQVWDRFGHGWASLALVFVWVWNRLEQV